MVLIYDDFQRDNLAGAQQILALPRLDETYPMEAVETQPLGGVRSVACTGSRARRGERAGIHAAGLARRALGALSALPARAEQAPRGSRGAMPLLRATQARPELTLELSRRFAPRGPCAERAIWDETWSSSGAMTAYAERPTTKQGSFECPKQ